MHPMEAEGDEVRSSLETPPWAVRIRRGDGRIVGTGILLSPDRVLTCAHVVARGERVTAEFVGARTPGRGVPSTSARVLDDRSYRPETRGAADDPSGDVALLRLDRPRPAAETTTLYRLSAPGRRVRMYGFPESYDRGVWLRATLLGGWGRDGQVQLVAQTPGEPVRPGFSGSGVVDHDTGEVIGMVLARAPEPGGTLSFMSPAETIVQHLPQVAEWTRGRTAVDETLRPAEPGGGNGNGSGDGGGVGNGVDGGFDEPFARRLARWFRDGARHGRDGQDDGHDGQDGEAGAPGETTRDEQRAAQNERHMRARLARAQVKISLVGRDDPAREATLRRAISLADRESRTPPATERASLDPPETVPSAGGLDLAVAAHGRTTDGIAERIADRMGLRRLPGEPAAERIKSAPVPLTLVMVGVDEAADPGSLLDLMAGLAARGSRLLLVFRTPGPHFERARRELLTAPAQHRRDRLAATLAEITGPQADALHRLMGLVRADTGRAVHALIRAHALETKLAGPDGGRGDRAGGREGQDRAPDEDRDAAQAHAQAGGHAQDMDPAEHVNPEETDPDLDHEWAAYERAADHALARLTETNSRLAGLLERRSVLVGRLGSYQAMYRRAVAEEDLAAEALYVAVYDLLHTVPCDVAAAEAAFRRYAAFVEGPRGDDPAEGGGTPR